MNCDSQRVFIGLMEFFSILLPGAVLTCLLMGEVGPVVLGDRYASVSLVQKPGPPSCSRAISSATGSSCRSRQRRRVGPREEAVAA